MLHISSFSLSIVGNVRIHGQFSPLLHGYSLILGRTYWRDSGHNQIHRAVERSMGLQWKHDAGWYYAAPRSIEGQ